MKYLLLILALCACSTSKISSNEAKVVNARFENRPLALWHSYYFGQAYDENELWLLSAYPFSNTHHLVDLNGKPLRPGVQHGIVPAGVEIVVESITFPTPLDLVERMLTTPRFHPWVILKIADQSMGSRVPAVLRGRRLLLLLPQNIETVDEAQRELEWRLGPSSLVNRWLENLEGSHQQAISKKTVETGMSTRALIAAVGIPQGWYEQVTPSGEVIPTAWYPEFETVLRDEKVSEISTPRPAQASVEGPVRRIDWPSWLPKAPPK